MKLILRVWGEVIRVPWDMATMGWTFFLAATRWSDRAVCEMSAKSGPRDFHDYPDSIEGQPWHMTTMTCKRCGKKFRI